MTSASTNAPGAPGSVDVRERQPAAVPPPLERIIVAAAGEDVIPEGVTPRLSRAVDLSTAYPQSRLA